MRVDFIENYDISKLIPADYNPRKLENDKFEKLKESIQKFGIIKPLIINGANGILTAGHQRTRAIKAVGLKFAPVIRINGINVQDEIRFNLFHNSIETNKSTVRIENFAHKKGEYSIIPYDKFNILNIDNSVIIKEIGRLILKYGEWGSIVCDEDGNVILNSDYAVAAKQLKHDVICYTISNDQKKELLQYLSIDYGVYHYDSLGIKSYNQLYCQMNRLTNSEKKKNRSTLYERYVLPTINRELRILDFGAGKCAYVNLLRQQGFRIFAYEPNFQNSNRNIDINVVVSMIKEIENEVRANGLFDVVILDSVLNSVVNTDVEKYVICTCNSFLKANGKLFVATRNLEAAEKRMTMDKSNSRSRLIEFLDKDNFSATFRDGVWTMQHFHSRETLHNLLTAFFTNVKVEGIYAESQLYAIAQNPIAQNIEYAKQALEFELNMEYPNNFKHNQHYGLLSILIEKLGERK